MKTTAPLLRYTLATLLLVAPLASSHASVLVQDSFDANNWNLTNSSSISTSITNSQLKISATGSNVATGAAAYRTIDSTSSDSLFISFTIQASGYSTSNDFLCLWLDNSTTFTDVYGNHSGDRFNGGVGLDGNFFAREGSVSTRLVTGPSAADINNQSYTIVAEYSKSVSGGVYDTVKLWINPTNSSYSIPVGTATVAGSTALSTIDTIGFRVASLDTNDTFYIDNFVIATTWNEVVVPEPSSYALLVTGCLLLGFVVKRKSIVPMH